MTHGYIALQPATVAELNGYTAARGVRALVGTTEYVQTAHPTGSLWHQTNNIGGLEMFTVRSLEKDDAPIELYLEMFTEL